MNKILSILLVVYLLLLAPFPVLVYCMCVEEVFAGSAIADDCCDFNSKSHFIENKSSTLYYDSYQCECELCVNIPISFHKENELSLSSSIQSLKIHSLNLLHIREVYSDTQSKKIKTFSNHYQKNQSTLILPCLQTVRLLI